MNGNRRLAAVSAAVAGLLWGAPSPVLAEAEEEETRNIEEVTVQGRRISQTDMAIGVDETSNTVAVTRAELLSAPSGISGLKMLENLPGFNVQTDGALGLYEFGNSVQVRAFNLPQIGFVLNGIPMGRSDAFGGSPIFRYVDNENLASVVASPGAGDVSGPSYATLGPIAFYEAIEPSEDFGVMAAYTAGQFNLERSFVRINTGNIGGFRGYVSRSKTDSDLWRGPGDIDREHWEGQVRYDLTENTMLKGSFVSNDFFDYDSPSAPEATFEQDYDFGYLPFVPNSCIAPDPGVFDFDQDGDIDGDDFTPVFTDGSCTQYFEDRVNIRDDKLYSLGVVSQLTSTFSVDATWYYEDKDGFGVSPDSYGNSRGIFLRQQAAGLDVVHPRGVQYGLSTVGGDRQGAVVDFGLELANHSISFGGWIEDETYNRTQLRLNKTAGSADGQVLPDEVAYFRRDYETTRETLQLYLSDTIRLLDDRLSLEIGFKSLSIDYGLEGFRDFNDYEVDSGPGFGPADIEADYSDSFLPMIGFVYQLDRNTQVFGSYGENYALPQGADDIFDNAVSFTPEQPDAEEAQNWELGIRTNRANYNGTLALFYTAFDNRLFQSNVFNPATEQPEAFFVNGGESTAYGIELSGVVQPEVFQSQVYFDANFSYKIAELEDGFNGNPAGSQLPDSPEWLVTTGMTWEPTNWLVANLSAKYTSERYSDFSENVELESYTVVSAYVDVGGPNRFGVPENLRLRVNVDNLLDEEAFAFAFTGSTFGRPLNERTVQATLTYEL
ncbi:MAG: TonB-dependent receptor [Pseudomonadales bacterium]|nr:TonB-dependent receptor [Pseudomonadales bacterium]